MNAILKSTLITSILLIAPQVLAQEASSTSGVNDYVTKLAARLKLADANNDGAIDADEAAKGIGTLLDLRIFGPAKVESHYPMQITDILKIAEKVAPSGSSAPSSSSSAATSATATPPSISPPSDSAPQLKPSSIAPAGAATAAGSASMGPAPVATLGPASTAKPSPSVASAPPKEVNRPGNKFGRPLTPAQLLPDGLPAWFRQKMDHDGQITMAEYTRNWTDADVKTFEKYDLNHDGIITAAEVLKVEKRGGR